MPPNPFDGWGNRTGWGHGPDIVKLAVETGMCLLAGMSHPLLALSAPGFPELVFIFMLCLLMFGAKKLPELAKGLGKSLGEFQKAKAEFEREIAKAAHPVEIKDQPDKVACSVNPVASVSLTEPSEPKGEVSSPKA